MLFQQSSIAHWIEAKETWTLCSQVIAFQEISGAHTGHNLRQYFVCQRADMINADLSKVCHAYH